MVLPAAAGAVLGGAGAAEAGVGGAGLDWGAADGVGGAGVYKMTEQLNGSIRGADKWL